MTARLIVSLRMMMLFTLVFGLLYPVAITVLGQVLLPFQANGSLIEINGKIAGSRLLAQKTGSSRYFWPRPSISEYAAVPSFASQLGPTSRALLENISQRKSNGFTHESVFASASGLDPHISLAAAEAQLERIAESRQLDENGRKALRDLVRSRVEARDLGFLGEERINVLLLNLELDKRFGR